MRTGGYHEGRHRQDVAAPRSSGPRVARSPSGGRIDGGPLTAGFGQCRSLLIVADHFRMHGPKYIGVGSQLTWLYGTVSATVIWVPPGSVCQAEGLGDRREHPVPASTWLTAVWTFRLRLAGYDGRPRSLVCGDGEHLRDHAQPGRLELGEGQGEELPAARSPSQRPPRRTVVLPPTYPHGELLPRPPVMDRPAASDPKKPLSFRGSGEVDETPHRAADDVAAPSDPATLSVSATSAGVSCRISILRTAPAVSQVAKPSGWLGGSRSACRPAGPRGSTATISLSSIQQRITSSVTRTRNLYQVLFWYSKTWRGLVLRGVRAVEAGEAGHVAAPAAVDQRDERLADGERRRGEEVGPPSRMAS